jgi:hypothetical protein
MSSASPAAAPAHVGVQPPRFAPPPPITHETPGALPAFRGPSHVPSASAVAPAASSRRRGPIIAAVSVLLVGALSCVAGVGFYWSQVTRGTTGDVPAGFRLVHGSSVRYAVPRHWRDDSRYVQTDPAAVAGVSTRVEVLSEPWPASLADYAARQSPGIPTEAAELAGQPALHLERRILDAPARLQLVWHTLHGGNAVTLQCTGADAMPEIVRAVCRNVRSTFRVQ